MTRIMNVNGKFTDIYSYVKNILFLMVLLTVGATCVWADDLSGLYYIASGGLGENNGKRETYNYNSANPGDNFYLCPTEGWCYYKATDDFWPHNTADENKTMPFLTTYKCKDGVYDASKALWVIEKAPSSNYYYIKQWKTGRYLVANGIIRTTSGGWDRMRIHLEEVATPSDKGNDILFNIYDYTSGNKTYKVIQPMGINEPKNGFHDGHNTHKWLTVSTGNYNHLVGQPDKANGPEGYANTAGIVGIYTEADANAPFYLEDASVAVPTFSMNGAGDVTITAESGTTIHYTLDGTTPTEESTTYSAAITAGTISADKTVRAIAVRTSDGVSSAVATLPLVTYHIVNKSNNIAVSSMPRRQVAGTSISGYASIPTEIRSLYISNENITFYSWEGAFNASNLDIEHRKTTIPAQSADAEGVNIYVTYSTDRLNEKFLRLQMARPMNIKHEESSVYKYIYDNSGTVTYDASEAASITDSRYLWYIGNNTAPDPYNVLVKNSSKTSNLKYASPNPSDPPALSLDADAISYVITDTTNVDANHQNITLKNFSTRESFTIRVNEVKIPTSYYLIDKADHIIFGPKESTSSTMEIPTEWYSPVVKKYHYWKIGAFDEEKVESGIYSLKENQTELNGLAELGTGEHIYITYDVDNELLDLDGRNSLEIEDKVNLTYRLQFSGGTNFYQEDGKDGVMTETRKPVYPYSNGDAALYVYGNERWEEQLANGATTRTRWLWYIEPARKLTSANTVDDLDPYHVKISSYQTQTSYKIDDDNTRNFHSYLKTYAVSYGNPAATHIVTGVTNDNPKVMNSLAADSDPADNRDATEYMILGASMTSLKLVTVDAISDGSTTERRTVNSFEQYWKNNPTVQKKLTTKVTAVGRNLTLTETQKGELPSGWHAYNAWANSQPWVHNNDNPGGTPTTGKHFLNEEHVFQTVSMGETFQFIETEIKPMLVLLDQHGWEIVRLPLPTGDPTKLTEEQKVERKKAYANLHRYSSPMVERYHFWKTGTKVPGYHKFTVSDPATEKNNPLKEYTTDELGRADIDNPNTPANLPDYQSQALASGKERDWYVTYDVKAKYTNAYTAAAEEGGTAAVPYLIKQNGSYAQYSGSGNTLSSTTTEPDITNVPAGMQWYIKPNFNIDKELGYHYEGQYEEKSKEDTDQDNYDAGMNGFDPYNVQIKSAFPNTDRYFTANTSGSAVTSLWAGTSSSITLENMTETTRQPGVVGLDQTNMMITNATFMVVDDGNGNMRLMPRFDNTKVMHSFTTLANPATANADSIAKQAFSLTQVPQVVKSSADIKVMGGTYLLDYPFDASDGSIGTKTAPFIGTLEGKIGQSFSVSEPFIAYADGATIKNVIIEEVSISSGNEDGHAGAIVATATGATRIYNCGVKGGSVSGTNYTGGIVGLLDHDPDKKTGARVINCYSYADITGGSYVGGIVGYNNFASDSTDIRTMVMNCMFYGDITGGTDKAPIYNGKIISNKDGSGLGNYNYFLADKTYVKNKQINTYNCALMAETRFLQRFEFYRLLLNSHLELAGWYATDRYDKNEMMKWVLETTDRTNANPKPYPVLKAHGKYPSIINIDAENAPEGENVDRNTGKKLGTLSVSIQMGDGAQFNRPEGATITEGSLSLPITDKDFERFNFNYRKVQLPYYNDVGTKNYTGNRVVTGWKIVSISGGTAGSFTTGEDAPAYNFADRNCTNKDLYSVSGRVFNQGAYWDVPEGVTGITIEPYWAHAVYLADAYTDVVYNQEMGTPYIVTAAGGQIYTNGSKYDIAGDNDQKVYTNVKDAREKLETNKTVYDCAIVLVGNFHNIGVSSTEGSRSYTIMSADFDHDNEPDYSYILRFDSRNQTHPVRVDFVNIPGLGMAQKSTGGKGTYNFGIMQPIGWFESTNTSLFRVTQLEYDRENRGEAPIIVQGGVIEQWVSGQSNKVANKTTYFHVGGNAWFKEFHRGTHQDQTYTSKHPPVSVTGGDYDEFYLTGLYRGDVASYADNAECYINGGRFGILAGAAQEGIGKANGADNTGNITWQIQNADIREFYGGGFNAAKPVTGNIATTITGSYVTTFCGGPKFGDMSASKTVITNATDCTFGTYFGAGYGGNSYSRQAPRNHNNIINFPHSDNQAGNHSSWNDWLDDHYKQAYNATYGGVSTQFNYQFLPMSGNKDNVARIFVEYVKFSLATTRNVTSTLTGCTVTGNFYGGGSLGKVDGNVTSTLNGCTVKGNVFGAGFSASLPPVEVDSLGFRKEPEYYDQTGTFAEGVKGSTTTYHWQHGDAISIDKENNILYTTEDLTGLGAVTGTVTLTIDGATVVGDNAVANSGNVYGGGESSDATGDVNVHVLNGSMTDVYGGGKGQKTVVGGDVTVNIGAKDGGGALSGSGTVKGSVYGGSALGVVNAISTKDANGDITGYTPTPNKTAHVNIYGGAVTGSVFGGGLGQLASAEPVQAAIAAQNFGDAIISMEGGSVGEAIYGGANANGVLKANAEVTLLGGTIGSDWGGTAPDPLPDVVFGGGKGEPTLVNGSVLVKVGTKSDDPTPVHTGTSVIYGNVYGGSALGHTNATSSVAFNASETTTVNLYAGTINGYVFGGGLGRKYKAAVAADPEHDIEAQSEVTAVESFVGGDVKVLLDGAKVRQVFGCNNLNGTPKGHVLVHVMLTNNFSGDNSYKNNSETALDARTTYDVEAVYGGGNKADYNPTKATDPDENVKKQAFAEVLIEGCDSTSIEYVYGGGNAAAVPADSITVKSVYIIGQLFGGGNGSGAGNPGADVGVINRDAYAADKSTGIYGTGIAKTKLIGGQIRYVYGGSNTKGNVRGGTSLERKESNTHCALKIKEIYGAGQLAPMDGDVIIKLDCMPEDFVSQVFGGAKNATINGNVYLTVSSGKFGRVFGGNNLGGSINGSIEVNAYEDGCKPLIIGELYGGGFNAPYSIWGCNDSDNDGTWTPNTPAGDPHVAEDADAISVYVYSCTSIGKVFGGGFGATANVVGNTHVWINTMQGLVNGIEQTYGEGVYIGKIGQVFGGGNAAPVKGDVTIDIGTATVYGDEKIGIRIINGTDYLKTTEDADTTITAGIYGGGNAADVDGNVTMNIGTVSQNQGINIGGDIYGGGYGETTLVTGNVTVNIGKKESETPVGYANITGDVYGGSAKGKVNTTDGSTTNKYKPNPAEETTADCYTHVNFYGGTLTGNLYGGGLGVYTNDGDNTNDYAADVYGPVTVTLEKGSTTNTVVNNVFGCNNVLGTPKNTVTVNINGGTVNHSVYGGGNQAAYTPTVELAENAKIYPAVNINNGTVTENVFGGGFGLTAIVTGNPHVTIGDNVEGHTVTILESVYGGGSLAGVNGNTNIVVNSGTIGTEGEGGATYGNIYGGGFGTMSTSEMTEAQAVKEAGIIKGNTNITVNGGTVLHNIYGGGANGSVGTFTYDGSNVITGRTSGGVANITILGGTIGTDGHENGMIFGASRGDVGKPGEIQDKLAWVYDTNVTIGNNTSANPQIKGSVYGSGENGHTYHNAAVAIHSGMVGITNVSIDGGAAYPYRGNVYGGGCGTDKYVDTGDGNKKKYNQIAGIVQGNAVVTIDGGHVVRNVYGGGAMGSVSDTTKVFISGKSVIGADGSGGGYVYAASRGYDDMEAGFATVGSTTLNISGGTIWQSAFGGGQLGTVKGSVAVNVSGGVVKNDVYGGGALANTNTDNWNANKDVTTYDEVTFLKVGESVVTGLYTKPASEYVKVTAENAKAENGVIYYRQIKGGWADDETTSTANTTTVTLTGGVIGNAYGGGLGDVSTPVYVFGDVTLSVNDPTKLGSSKGIGFTREIAENVVVAGKKYSSVPITGSVFGCNNINGTPRGEVTVTVYSTRQLDESGNVIPNTGPSSHSPNATNEYYEIQAVYGGGNQASYQPVTGKNTHVIIYGCDESSIEKVYGGGNSAAVPQTDVTIWGSFDINSAFGGGNGSLPIKRDGVWIENAGSEVYGNTNISCKGGKIGNVFGGSDAKGNIHGSMNTDVEHPEGGCALKITKIYGASKEADVDADVNVIISGCSSDEIEYVCGGSYNANIRGDITLTITSGFLKNVYGGNDARGSIGGNITVNIQEEDPCKPVIIQNLVGGGFAADYPGINFKTGENAKRVKRDSNGKYIKDGDIFEYEDFTEGKITVNVKSATRIDNIFGGGFRANVNGDTEVNINMVKGLWAGAQAPAGYTDLPNVHKGHYAKVLGLTVGTSSVTGYYEKNGDVYTVTSDVTAASGKNYYSYSAEEIYVIDDAIGTIGNVYGGGSEGVIYGNSIVNIGSSTTVPVMHRGGDGKFVTTTDVNDVLVIDYIDSPALGAHITGNVFGGGSREDVTGNSEVYICANKTGEGTYAPVAEGAEKVTISNGSVYGGGSVADVHGNTSVTMDGGYVFDGVYGGGLMGSVGTAADGEGNVVYHTGTEAHAGTCIGKIVNYKANTGKCTVVVNGGQVGPVETALADGGMKNTGRHFIKAGDDTAPVDVGFVFGAGRGEETPHERDVDTDFRTYVKETDVTIGGDAFIMASVYGGGENGRVRGNTHVKIQGDCQIGCGEGKVTDGKPVRYTAEQWTGENKSDFTECASWDYGKIYPGETEEKYLPYDPLASDTDPEARKEGSDGHTYYGSVFGGGSGYFPHEKADGTHDWLRSAGQVEGSTKVEITGGHILTCVYGGNETTDVLGDSCVVIMTGGTLGVPRTDENIKARPVTCYLFGAGKGDQRTRFNTWTNVQNTRVFVGGTARIFGSVFGGGEDGHILENSKVEIYNGTIGTDGTSYLDGNVFGGGRGFSGVALTAGSMGGNAEVTIAGGWMKGSVYGGGRLASVGIGFTSPEDIYYGQLKDDEGGNTYGHVTINISGGEIGNRTTETGAGHPISGNVFGGSMGRLTLLDGVTRIPLWPKQAVTKLSEVNISGGTIWNSVYGGSEIGVVRNHATVNVEGGTIHGNVFGGGYGSDEQDKKTIAAGGYDDIPTVYYTFTPMIWTGCVSGDTEVNISGGTIKKNVYGGGNYASVGLMNYNSSEDGSTYNYITKHNTTDGFGLSWPYEFQYIKAAPKDDPTIGGDKIGGKTTVNITGGIIGTLDGESIVVSGTGNVYGASKGMVSLKKEDNTTPITDVNEQRYAEAFCANVRETEVTIGDGGTPNIYGAVYGGGQDGHVMENAAVTVAGGTIGLSVYGGGQGESTFLGKLRDQSSGAWKAETEAVHSITAGKVYGNTSVSMTGGTVVGHVYGGGNLASVGKGNYAGGADDYYPAGYGEKLTGNLWDNVSDNSKAFLSSGHVTVSITGGTIGKLNGTSGAVYGNPSEVTPTGIVFGGSRGRAAQDITTSPRHEYAPDFFLGYVNTTKVTIGDPDVVGGPRIFSQVFGGGRDGHVRDSSYVIINKGIIGQTYSETTDDYQRYHRGNVYGSGSGLGQWTTGKHGMASGSVTNKTRVDINGGTIYNNVYGGGALSSVGPPRLDLEKDYAAATISQCVVNINGGTIGSGKEYESVYMSDFDKYGYGGCVYGASRGNDFLAGESPENFATVLWTKVNVNGGDIAGNVYGGAKGGLVWKDTEVHLKGGTIAHNAYGGGQGTSTIAANIGGNTTVTLNNNNDGGDADGSKKGCVVDKVFGCNDLNGTPKGHVLVHVYGTQNSGTANMSTKVGPGSRTSLNQGKSEGYIVYMNRLIDLAKDGGVVKPGITESVITTAEGTIDGKTEGTLTDGEKTAISNEAKNVIAELQKLQGYDVTAVYGGGDLAPYVPTVSEETTEVIIEGCDVTSIKQVYGGGNAAYVPATNVLVKSAYVIDELFGGGNGLDNYKKDTDGKWYENPGANVGYTELEEYAGGGTGTEGDPYKSTVKTAPDATTKEGRIANYSIGTGVASTMVNGGYIHHLYGGSNMKGNIRREALLQVQQAGACELIIDETTAGSKSALIDAETNTVLDCVKEAGDFYAGSTNADILNDVHVRITNGKYGKVFGGNKTAGTITGSITIDIQEQGCTPIEIDELYAGGYLAPYSVYGYSATTRPVVDENGNAVYIDDDPAKGQMQQRIPYKKGDVGALATPSRDPHINIISATKIGKIYGGGYMAELIGSPHINVNMTNGIIPEKYASEYPNATYDYITVADAQGNKIIPIGTIGTIYGGGNKGDIYGDTYVEIGTGTHHNDAGVEEVINPARNAAFILREEAESGRVYGGGNLGGVTGNTNIEMGNGYVYDRIYGGGKEGNVGKVTTISKHTGDKTHADCIGKPTAFAENTGRTAVTVSGGYVGPFAYVRSASTGTATITPMTMQGTGADGVAGPDDYGYVFGAGRGELTNPDTDKDVDFRTYVDSTVVTVKNGYVAGHEGEADYITRPLIAGGVYGGAENGRVLHNTHVNIQGGQIGIGNELTTAYAESAFIDPMKTTVTDENKLAECAAWPYGIDINDDKKKDTWLPYDEHAGDAEYDTENYGPASTTGSDGHTFYGNVFGGGSGYFTYPLGDGKYEWLPSAGLVEGDTYVNISGGHILTNVYGGNEMTNVTGTAHVTMTGGTLGVPRTLEQITAHPLTCYLFGAGKGDQRVHFNKSTNVGHSVVNVSGGIIYGSVFGGGEDGHVLGDVTMNINDGAKIGTWGTSYVDGNVFGGGRGFGGDAYTAGNVAGTVTLNITGGTMLGSIYGGGRLASVGYGLFSKNETGYGEMMADNATETGFVPVGGLTHGRGHVTMNISGGTIGNTNEFIMPIAANPEAEITGNIPTGLDNDFKNWSPADWTTWKNHNHVPYTEYDESNGRLTHTKGGNVYAGGMGRYTQLDGTSPITVVEWWKLGNVKSTTLTVSGTPWIMGNVYGGGELGAVNPYTSVSPAVVEGGTTSITITGGTIGTEVTGTTPVKTTVPTTTARSAVQYTFGSVYGGGMGMEEHDEVTKRHGGEVGGNTTVSMSGDDTEVRASVFGGGEMAIVDGNTSVTISDGKIGRKEVMPLTDKSDVNAGYVLFGGATMGNVYGGGKGILGHTEAGQVKGNTNVNITGGEIYHMVYGGGALGSVGDFKVSDGDGNPSFIPYAGIPYGWDTEADGETSNGKSTGIATVTITGGTIGISGRDNGLVFGSSRGDLMKPYDIPDDGTADKLDPYDRVAWVNKSIVTIGTAGQGNDAPQPQIKGSVYGGGENGHNNVSATVNVYSGTIGVTNTDDPYYDFDGNAKAAAEAQIYRGNVYGGGSGSDTYTGDDGAEYWNPKSGMVGGNTFVNIYGGHIGRSVYGGGAMASVGTITNWNDTTGVAAKHASELTSFALSWPYKFEFAPGTGKATVNVTGGHIGTRQLEGGDVYGSSRGVAGDRYKMAHLAWTKETEVNINYTSPYVLGENDTEATIQNDFTKQCITGSVHGSGENGYVYGDTHVTLNKGLIGHSLYGAGKGKGTYTKALNKIGGGGTYDAKIYSLIAGKVMGNTVVTMNGGHVMRNVYGGGNMGSVGKGNYAGGADDYYPAGYGETITGNLWTSAFNPEAAISESNKPDDAYYFLSSGKATVKVLGGIVGYVNKANPAESTKGLLPYGNVFGGSAGEAAPNVANYPRYEYSPAFFSGYVNETDVTIGTSGQVTDADAGQTGKAPRILSSVYGGGQDGHVRRDAKVTVYSGEIGMPYTSTNTETLGTNLDSPQWMHRGNIYGGGSGITEYHYDYNYDGDTEGENEHGFSDSSGSVTRFTDVNILGGIIHRNVYGGGSMGSVGAPKIDQDYDLAKKNLEDTSTLGKQSQNTVTIGGGSSVVTIGTPFNSTRGWTYNKTYGGEVYGACRGMSELNPEEFSTSVWTLVNIKNKATIMGNVYGGGDNGIVKKNAEVVIGNE